MKRGDVWWVNFDPAIGSEIKKCRPAVIVSSDESNQFMDRLQVVPVTSNTSKFYPSEAFVSINGKLGKAMADQLNTVSKERFRGRLGKISENEMKALERAIRIQLDML